MTTSISSKAQKYYGLTNGQSVLKKRETKRTKKKDKKKYDRKSRNLRKILFIFPDQRSQLYTRYFDT